VKIIAKKGGTLSANKSGKGGPIKLALVGERNRVALGHASRGKSETSTFLGGGEVRVTREKVKKA